MEIMTGVGKIKKTKPECTFMGFMNVILVFITHTK